jgi:hypothetical protein
LLRSLQEIQSDFEEEAKAYAGLWSQGKKKEALDNRALNEYLDVAGDWRRLHSEEFHNLCASPNVIRAIKSRSVQWAGHVARVGEMRNARNILVGKSERKGPLGRHGHRKEDNIRMNLREIMWEGVDLNASGS